jgi:hypothetical protein
MKDIRINESSDQETFEINGQYFFKINNIYSYGYDASDLQTWTIKIDDSVPISNEANEYFIIDTIFHEAFSHWIYESSIYLRTFLLLKQMNPSLKLHLLAEKGYKKLFCRFFGINESDIVYTIPTGVPNICYIPKYSKLIPRHESDDIYRGALKELFDFFSRYKTEIINSVDICILPRQRKENYANNDRVVSINKLLGYLSESKKYTYDVVETDIIEDISDQIQRVRSSKYVILSDGAAYSVNGMFCRDQTILVLGSFSIDQESQHPRGKAILTKIKENNSVIHFNSEEEIIQYLDKLYP